MILSSREKHGFNVSIATGLAMETLFKTDEFTGTISPSKEFKNYTRHYYNFYTIIRNIVSAIQHIDKPLFIKNFKRSNMVYDVLKEELEIVSLVYSQQSNIVPILYIPNYSKLKLNVLFKEIKTPPTYADELNLIYKEVLLIFNSKDISVKCINIDIALPSTPDKTLITTHIMFDLLNINKLPNMCLLEGTTGIIKTKEKFNTKYSKAGKLDLSILPFTEYLAYIYGDKDITKSMKYNIKKDIYDLALEKKWNVYTSKNIVHDHMKQILVKYNIVFKPLY